MLGSLSVRTSYSNGTVLCRTTYVSEISRIRFVFTELYIVIKANFKFS